MKLDNNTIPLLLPPQLYADLEELALNAQVDPVEIITRLVANAQARQTWIRNLNALREEIRKEGELQVGRTKDEVVDTLRKTRREIFEAEYAHLYR